MNYHLDGRERQITIGRWPTWTVDAARDEAKELRRQIDGGEDPAGSKRERREAPTVQDLIDRYVAQHLPTKTAGGPRQKIVQQRISDEKKMLGEVGDCLGKHTKVADIHAGDIQEMHRKISETVGRQGPRRVRANRILAVASKMFSLASLPEAGENVPWRNAAQGNPCKGVKKNPEDGRERYYSPLELAAIADALGLYGSEALEPSRTVAKAAADAVRLIMFTGCRPQEAMLATWQQFDTEPGFWVKPSAHTKQRKTHKLPLSPLAIELVDRMRAHRANDATWIFPGAVPGQPLAAFHHVWAFVRQRAKLGEDARLYDLRHTYASIGAGGGLSLLLIGRLLGHTQARTTQRYAHLADDPVREAAARIGAVISGAGKQVAEIVPMKARGHG